MATTKKATYTKVGKSGEMIEVERDEIRKKKKSGLNLPPEYLSLGMYLALPLLLGVFVGQYFDRKFGTKAIFTITFIVFGTISVFYNLYRLYNKDTNERTRT